MIVNKSEAAEAFGVTPNTISSWIDKGMPYERDGYHYKIDLTEAIEWHVEWKTETLEEELSALREGRTSEEHYDLEYKKWKSTRMKIEAVKESGQLVTLDEAEQAMLTRLVQIRDTLKNIPISWVHRVVGLETKKEAQEKLEELLDELLTELSSKPDDVEHVEEGQEILDIDIEDVKDIEDYD